MKSFQLPLASFASFLGSIDDQPPVIGDHGNLDIEDHGDEDILPMDVSQSPSPDSYSDSTGKQTVSHFLIFFVIFSKFERRRT